MVLFITLAWRNVFRNKRRSFIAGIAIGMGLASLIFVDAFVIGMTNNMVASATSTFMGEAQIHADGYRDTQEVSCTVHEQGRLVERLHTDARVAAFSERVFFFGMITSPANVTALGGVGIDFSQEKVLSIIDDAMVAGVYDAGPDGIVIGSELAEILEVAVGDRVVVTAAQSGTGDLSQQLFRVKGIFTTHIKEMDQDMGCTDIHEIALKFTDSSIGYDQENSFFKEYSYAGNEAVSWTALMPQMLSTLKMTQYSTLIAAVILFLIIALGIINTIFMSLYERMFEFGVLRSVGTRPARIAMLIMFEAAVLALLSSLIGLIIGVAAVRIVSYVGIDYTGIEFSGVTFRHIIYPVLQIKQFIIYPAGLCVFTVLISLYPALFAARMNPTQAMRRSM